MFSMKIAPLLLQLDTRVDDLVQDIHDHVCNNDHAGQQNGGAHDQGVVTVGDGRHEVAAQTGHGEDLFHHEGTGHQAGQHGADVGDDRQNGVAQCVLEQDHELGNALCACGAHIVLTHNVQQAGAHQTGDISRGIDGQCGDRHDIGGCAVQTNGGQHLHVHTKLVQKQHAGNKAGDRDATGCKHDNEVIQPLTTVIGRNAAQRDAHAQSHNHCNACQTAGHRQLAGNDLVHGTL